MFDHLHAPRAHAIVVHRVAAHQGLAVEIRARRIECDRDRCGQDALAELLLQRLRIAFVAQPMRFETMADDFMEKHAGCAIVEYRRAFVGAGDRRIAQGLELGHQSVDRREHDRVVRQRIGFAGDEAHHAGQVHAVVGLGRSTHIEQKGQFGVAHSCALAGHHPARRARDAQAGARRVNFRIRTERFAVFFNFFAPDVDVEFVVERRLDQFEFRLAAEVVGLVLGRGLHGRIGLDLGEFLHRAPVGAVGCAPDLGAHRALVVVQTDALRVAAACVARHAAGRLRRVGIVEFVVAGAHLDIQRTRVQRRTVGQRAEFGIHFQVFVVVDAVGDEIGRHLGLEIHRLRARELGLHRVQHGIVGRVCRGRQTHQQGRDFQSHCQATRAHAQCLRAGYCRIKTAFGSRGFRNLPVCGSSNACGHCKRFAASTTSSTVKPK